MLAMSAKTPTQDTGTWKVVVERPSDGTPLLFMLSNAGYTYDVEHDDTVVLTASATNAHLRMYINGQVVSVTHDETLLVTTSVGLVVDRDDTTHTLPHAADFQDCAYTPLP